VPVYAYRGITAKGRNTRGFVDAESDRGARARLKREGIFLTELLESASRPGEPRGGRDVRALLTSLRPVSPTDLAIATRQLATLLGAGIPLIESLGALADQVENARLKGVIGQVRDRVNAGAALADALAAAGPFSELYVSLVRAGETGGALDTVLRRLADTLEAQVRTRNKVSAIILYPAMMLVVASGVVVALVTVVLPRITRLLESLGQELPWYTQAIIGGSRFVQQWWWALLVVALAGGVGFHAFSRSKGGRRSLDAIKLRLPVVGRLLRILAIGRFTRTLSALLAGGIPIVRALEISKQTTANLVIGAAVERAKEAIVEGASIAAPLRASGQFPPLVTHMVDIGERSGELESMLAKVADTYDEQVETAITRLTALLEPALILIMVGIVLVIILSTLVPLLQLTSRIQG